MSGHSHFATIKRQKAVNDKAKGNLFSKMARTIMVAAKGGADPDMNFKLRVEIDKARAASMPKENIDRAIAKATTEASSLEEVTYEGFGPNGLNVVVEAATDNKNRTAQEIKNTFDKAGGSLGGPGSVLFNFDHLGFIFIKKVGDSETQMLKLIDLGVEDITENDEEIEAYVSTDKLRETRKNLEAAEFVVNDAGLTLKPKISMKVESVEQLQKIMNFLEALEDFDDVLKVSTNLEVPDEIAAQLK
ncbi:MAG TPA: YebC/PmpR family DNA-binding transcriptional regulator [Patescibacteria group bacterium]|nr:YebC/PmpR family DNA-binding transcriptional regulator [Patescibacteria group bacterium]